MPNLKFRVHHFLCATAFEGKGYSPEFVKNFYEILDTLQALQGDETLIEVVEGSDSICAPCPNRQGEKCLDQSRISQLDFAHAQILGLKPGDQITWGEAKRRLGKLMSLEKFNQACAPCSWKAMGVCEKKLKELQKRALVLLVPFFLMISPRVEANPVLQGIVLPGSTDLSPSFLDELLNELRVKKKNQAAAQIRQVAEALDQGRLVQARTLAELIKSDPLFSDYGWYYAGQYQLAEARKALQRSAFISAVDRSEKAVDRFLRVEGVRAGSALVERVPLALAQSEMVASAAWYKRKSYTKSVESFERALERIPGNQILNRVSLDLLQAYVLACSKLKERPCRPWMQRLVRKYPDRSAELTFIHQTLPWSVDLPSPERTEPREKTYKAPDQDLTAINETMDLLLKRDGDAFDRLIEFLRSYPKSKHRFRALYWLARLFEEKGEKERANDMFITILSSSPYSYYALLSSLRSGRGLENYIDATIPQALSTDPFLTANEIEKLTRAEHLIAELAYEQAAWELQGIHSRDELSEHFLMYLSALQSTVNSHLSAFKVLGDLITRAHTGIYSTYGLNLVFPQPFEVLIQQKAQQDGLDPLVVRSLMKQESAFVHDIISWAGASGLMQIMPFTALDMDLKVNQFQLANPEVNVSLGAGYLARVMKKFDGNIVYSLAGYNAGPHRVSQWKKSADPAWGMLEFIEAIPYSETRDYVQKIMRNYYWYAYITKGQKTDLNYFWAGGPNG